MAVASGLGKDCRAFLMATGECTPLSRWITSREGGRVTVCLHTALMRCCSAARIVGRGCGLPLVIAAFAASSTSSFSCIPTCAGHHTKVSEKCGEVSSKVFSASRVATLIDRAGVVPKRWVRACINARLSTKNQKLRWRGCRWVFAASATNLMPTSSASYTM